MVLTYLILPIIVKNLMFVKILPQFIALFIKNSDQKLSNVPCRGRISSNVSYPMMLPARKSPILGTSPSVKSPASPPWGKHWFMHEVHNELASKFVKKVPDWLLNQGYLNLQTWERNSDLVEKWADLTIICIKYTHFIKRCVL